MVASISFVHILQYAFTITMREVDVDIGRLLSLLREEPLEQQLHANGIDGRNAQAIAHGGVGGGTASLTQDAFTAREANNVPDNEKEPCHLQFRDHAQLVRQLCALLRLVAGSPPFVRPLVDQPREIFVGGDAGGQREGGHGRLELRQTKRTAFGHGERGLHAVFGALPSLHDQGGRLERPLGVGTQARAHFIECAFVP